MEHVIGNVSALFNVKSHSFVTLKGVCFVASERVVGSKQELAVVIEVVSKIGKELRGYGMPPEETVADEVITKY